MVHLVIVISSFSFLTQLVISLVLGMRGHFLLYPGHFDYYVIRPWVLF